MTSSFVAAGEPHRPRVEASALAELLGADLLGPVDDGILGAASRRLRLDFAQAVAARRRDAKCYLTWSERIAMPLAALDRDTPHATLAHALGSRLKRRMMMASGVAANAKQVGVFNEVQHRIANEDLRIAPRRLSVVPYAVDEHFFDARPDEGPGDYVLSVGRESRDWGTLAEAVRISGVRCVVVGGSPWSRGRDGTSDETAFEWRSGLTYEQLRETYARARLVVLPVTAGTTYAAGLTSLREAQAVGRPVLFSDVEGLRGISGGGTVSVVAGDPVALAKSMTELWEDDDRLTEIGAAGWARAREHTFDGYVAHLAEMMNSA